MTVKLFIYYYLNQAGKLINAITGNYDIEMSDERFALDRTLIDRLKEWNEC